MKMTDTEREAVRNNQAIFLRKYGRFHIPWMKQLTAAYMERGQFPMLPTFIANYYTEAHDREIALLSAIFLDWKGDVMTQIKALMDIMGDHPYEWFTSRGFVHLSVGRNQNKRVEGRGNGQYWKLARFYSMLYDHCRGRSLRASFPAGADSSYKTRLVRFGEEVNERLGFFTCGDNADVVELALRASDGISFGLWPTDPSKIHCPYSAALKRFLKMWFPDYRPSLWGYSESVRLFGLERDYDFFYFYLAWEELKKANRDGCVRYSTRYISRYKGGYLMGPVFWTGKRGLIPEIKFLD